MSAEEISLLNISPGYLGGPAEHLGRGAKSAYSLQVVYESYHTLYRDLWRSLVFRRGPISGYGSDITWEFRYFPHLLLDGGTPIYRQKLVS